MRKRRALAVAILAGVLVLAVAAPAQAGTRRRFYKGKTSQSQNIAFVVAKTDEGRFVREIRLNTTLTCEDQTTQGWGIGFGLGRRDVPITDNAFSFDENLGDIAVHVAGELGSLAGQGTASMVAAALTPDEQAQLCTTGDLTWEAEFVRTISRSRLRAGERVVSTAPAR